MSVGTEGNNYGLNNNYDYYEIQLDSRDAKNTLYEKSTGDPILAGRQDEKNITNWPLYTIGRPISGIAALKVIEAEIPFSYYVVNESNNRFVVNENGGAFQPVITIPPGNYTASTLASTLQGLLNAATSYFASVSPTVYTVTYDNITGKFTFDLNITVSMFTGFSFITYGAGPIALLGLGHFPDVINFSVNPTGLGLFSYRLVSFFVAEVTGPNYLYINSNLQGQSVGFYLPDSSWTRGQISPQIAKIPVTVNAGGVIFYKDPDPQKWFDVENQVNLVNIDIYCTLGNSPQKIDFNGVGFSIKLGILTTRLQRTNNMSGLTSEGRVTKRMYAS